MKVGKRSGVKGLSSYLMFYLYNLDNWSIFDFNAIFVLYSIFHTDIHTYLFFAFNLVVPSSYNSNVWSFFSFRYFEYFVYLVRYFIFFFINPLVVAQSSHKDILLHLPIFFHPYQ